MTGHNRSVSGSARTRRRSAWCTSAPGTGVPVWCACAPDHRARETGTEVPLPSMVEGAYRTDYADPRSNRELPGASVTEPETDIVLEARSGRRSRIWITSRVTGHRPAGLVDRRGGSAYRSNFIRVMIALRYRRAIARFRGSRRGQRRCPRCVRRIGPAARRSDGRAASPRDDRARPG